MSEGSERNPTVSRERFPAEVYAAHADYVQLAMKTMTARRMVGWLREYADYCEVSGATTTADHASTVANRLAAEVEPESVEPSPEAEDFESPDPEDVLNENSDADALAESGQGGDDGDV